MQSGKVTWYIRDSTPFNIELLLKLNEQDYLIAELTFPLDDCQSLVWKTSFNIHEIWIDAAFSLTDCNKNLKALNFSQNFTGLIDFLIQYAVVSRSWEASLLW